MTGFWQNFEPHPNETPTPEQFVARMPDGSGLALPMRDLGDFAVAGLISTQASFAVVDRIADWMADVVAPLGADIVAGLPTLGHVFASLLARRLGHPNWVALGTTRSFGTTRRCRCRCRRSPRQPRGGGCGSIYGMLPRLHGRRVLLVDDVISTGTSARAGLAVLQAAGTPVAAVAVAMAQASRWRTDWPANVPLRAAFATPMFSRTQDGWVPIPGSAASDCVGAGSG